MSRILVTGARGMLGLELVKRFGDRCLGVDLPEADVTVPEAYCRSLTVTAGCHSEHRGHHRCGSLRKESVPGGECASRWVTILAGTGVRLITISTDHVFTDGGGEYLTETSPVNPVNRYAASKYRGEAAALENPANAVVRTSWLVGKKECSPGWLTGSKPWGRFPPLRIRPPA